MVKQVFTSGSMWDVVPFDQGPNLGSLHWEPRVLATRSAREVPVGFYFFLICKILLLLFL